jgi:hypothetical protein
MPSFPRAVCRSIEMPSISRAVCKSSSTGLDASPDTQHLIERGKGFVRRSSAPQGLGLLASVVVSQVLAPLPRTSTATVTSSSSSTSSTSFPPPL